MISGFCFLVALELTMLSFWLKPKRLYMMLFYGSAFHVCSEQWYLNSEH